MAGSRLAETSRNPAVTRSLERSTTISQQYGGEILLWRGFSGVHAKVPVPADVTPDQRPLDARSIVAELEPHDDPGIGEPDDQVEIIVGEPATARLTRRLTGGHFAQHAMSTPRRLPSR